MTTAQLLEQFNIVARTDYNKEYQSFEPQFADLLHEYESGPVDAVNFPFFGFLTGMEEFTGSRIHQTFPDGYSFRVVNKEWDMSVDIPRKDIERAANVNALAGLNPYRQRISEMPRLAKDHPVELAFDMLEAGAASTYGTTFDGQTFFATTHSYSTAAGTQNNVTTGTGATTVATIIADVIKAMSLMNSFTFSQNGTTNSKLRKLNKSMDKLLIVCPDQLWGLFNSALNQERLANGESNPLQSMSTRITVISRPFTDANDWYMINLSDPFFRPFLYQVEKPVELDMPTLQDDNARENKIFTWGAYGRYNVAYGAWWTAVKVTNT